MLETLDYTIRIGSTPTFLYFDLYLYSAYAAHYVYCSAILFTFHSLTKDLRRNVLNSYSIFPGSTPNGLRISFLYLWGLRIIDEFVENCWLRFDRCGRKLAFQLSRNEAVMICGPRLRDQIVDFEEDLHTARLHIHLGRFIILNVCHHFVNWSANIANISRKWESKSYKIRIRMLIFAFKIMS